MNPGDGSLWSLLGLAFVLGLSHGADPDHLTAIDGMTRASIDRHPRLSRWVGTWFAFGHAITVLSLAGVIALAADYLQSFSDSVSQLSGVISAMLLFAIGTLNLLRLVRSSTEVVGHHHGLSRWRFPRPLLDITHPMSAAPIGALFGLGFETASQMSAWALAGTMGYGIAGTLLIGAAFSLGMVVTDSINGLMVCRMYVTATTMAIQSNRLVTFTVVIVAYGVGVVKLLQVSTLALPISDTSLTVAVVVAVLLTYVFARGKGRWQTYSLKGGQP